MEDSPVAFRLKNLIEALSLSDSQFADKCAISRSTLSLILSGKNKKISDVMLTQIHEAFPKVNIIWLLFGEGDLFINEKTPDTANNEKPENLKFQPDTLEQDEQLNLVNVKQLENIVQDVVNKSYKSSFSTLENLILKTPEPVIPRKINKITVYYDDSTFETFIPENY